MRAITMALLLTITSGLLAVSSGLAWAQGSYDCTAVNIEEVDESKLTKKELLALEEQKLFESVEGYSTCMQQAQTEAANAVGASGAGAGTGTGSQQGTGNAGGSTAGTQDTQNTVAMSNEPVSQKNGSSGGAKNQVIAPKDNDSVVCKILYEEITNETDDLKKAGLRKQYEEYSCG